MATGGIKRRGGRLVFSEWLNPRCGFHYTIRRKLYSGRSKYQKIDLVDTDEFGTVLLLDHVTQVAERSEYQYHEPMVHPALCAHPRPSDVLVIGGGDGGILREVLKYRAVRTVAFAELDREVVEFSRRHLARINGGAFEDARVRPVFGDGRAFVEQHPGRFDVVIMDMTDPFGPSRMLYTREFLRAVKRSFKDRRGIFVMHSESPVMRPFAFNSVQRTLAAVFRHVGTLYLYIQMYATLWSVAVASDTIDLGARTASAVNASLRRRGIRGLKLYSGATHRAMLVPFPYLEEIRRGPGEVITDASPDLNDNIHQSR